MRKYKKWLAGLLAVSILLLPGCGASPSAAENPGSVNTPVRSAPSERETISAETETAVPESFIDSTAEDYEVSEKKQTGTAAVAAVKNGTIDREKPLPLCDEKESLSWWLVSTLNNSDVISDYNDHRGLDYVESLTNVHMDITQCNMLTAGEQFNLMVASGDTTDIISSFEDYYSQGIESAIDEGIIINLLDYIDDAPIYQQMLDADSTLEDECSQRVDISAHFIVC